MCESLNWKIAELASHCVSASVCVCGCLCVNEAQTLLLLFVSSPISCYFQFYHWNERQSHYDDCHCQKLKTIKKMKTRNLLVKSVRVEIKWQEWWHTNTHACKTGKTGKTYTHKSSVRRRRRRRLVGGWEYEEWNRERNVLAFSVIWKLFSRVYILITINKSHIHAHWHTTRTSPRRAQQHRSDPTYHMILKYDDDI